MTMKNTNENAKRFLPLVQAVADGKRIQVRGKDGKWYGTSLEDIDPDRYRIKPEPRTFQLYIIDRGDGEPVITSHPTMDHRWKQITVQEVLA